VTCYQNLLDAKDAPGWWSKLGMFAPGMLPERPTLYLDLDNVVCGDLTPLVTLDPAPSRPFGMLEDGVHTGLPNSAVLWFDPTWYTHLYEVFEQSPKAIRRQFSRWPHASDQAYIAAQLGHLPYFLQDRLPPGFFMNSRTELEQGRDYRAASIVYGCWTPKPHESSHPFYAEHWRD
jgi:hypothetical protein